MFEPVHIAVDTMGGDLGPRPVVKASLALLNTYPQLSLTLVGRSSEIEETLQFQSLPEKSRIFIQHADGVVSMSDRPGLALRQKQNSSMWRCLEMVAEGSVDGCMSGGNTGALMAMSRHLIGTIEGIARPAICKPIPTATGNSFLLDLGANLNCSPAQLHQFAVMGAALAKVNGCSKPKVALLNVGAETTKGAADIQETAQLLDRDQGLEFIGFIEGHTLYSGTVDVIVCDGFIGNVALKVSEGVANFIFSDLRRKLSSGFWPRFIGFIAAPVLRAWAEQFNPSRYNGAVLLGLNKTVVKSHGGASELGVQKAIQTALEHVNARIPERISQRLATEN